MGDKSCAVVTFRPDLRRHQIPAMVNLRLMGAAYPGRAWWVWGRIRRLSKATRG